MATLENVLAPVYLMHRYQAEAATKLIGGINYTYAARGDGQTANEPLPADQQRAALDAVLETLRPEFLEVPGAFSHSCRRDLPAIHAIVRPSIHMRVWCSMPRLRQRVGSMPNSILPSHPERLARVVAQNAQSSGGLSLPEIFDAIEHTAERDGNQSGRQKEITRATEKQYLNHLLKLALNHSSEQQVTGYVIQRVADLETKIKTRAANDPAEKAQAAYLLSQIEQFHRDPKALDLPKPPKIPDGSPIGADVITGVAMANALEVGDRQFISSLGSCVDPG